MSEIKKYKPTFPAKSLPVELKNVWSSFWNLKIAQMVEEQSVPVVVRYLTYKFEWEQLTDIWLNMPLEERIITTTNTKGATIRQADPIFKMRMDLDSKLKAAETELGLTPRASAALGLAVSEAKQKWDSLRMPEGEEKEKKIKKMLEGVV